MGRAFQADTVGGVPSVSLPAGVTAQHGPYPAGLPVGLLLTARRKADDYLLAVASQVERVLPPPPVAPFPPPCSGCVPRLGFAEVPLPPSLTAAAAASSMASSYSSFSYVLDFDGSCDAKADPAAPLPMRSPLDAGGMIDWSTRAGAWGGGAAGVGETADAHSDL